MEKNKNLAQSVKNIFALPTRFESAQPVYETHGGQA